MLGEHLHVADNGHEVGVAVPARHDVPVAVLIDAGAGHAAEVHADVEAVRAHRLFQDGGRTPQQIRERGVLYVSRKWPPAVGGMETYSKEITTELGSRVPLQVIALPGRPDGKPPAVPAVGGSTVAGSVRGGVVRPERRRSARSAAGGPDAEQGHAGAEADDGRQQ